MFKNFNSEYLLIGILIVFIVFIFLSRENFNLIPSMPTVPNFNLIPSIPQGMPTIPNHFLPRPVPLNLPIPANKTCPPNSTLIGNICQYPDYIPRRSWGRGCPDNYKSSAAGLCKVKNPIIEPTLICDEGLVLKDGMCVQECPGKFIGAACMVCDKGKLEGGMCISCPNNKEFKNGLCYGNV